jgi:hypothetical protein
MSAEAACWDAFYFLVCMGWRYVVSNRFMAFLTILAAKMNKEWKKAKKKNFEIAIGISLSSRMLIMNSTRIDITTTNSYSMRQF